MFRKKFQARVIEIADQPGFATIAWCKTIAEGRLIAVTHRADLITREQFLADYAPGSVVGVMAPPKKR